MKFAERFKELRLAKGLTQIQAAEQLHVHNGTLGNWEIGKILPSITMAWKIADFFDVSIDYLLGRSEY